MRKAVMFFVSFCLLVTITVNLSGCNYQVQPTADSAIAQKQEKSLEEGAREVPPASIVNWNEKRQLKLILEKRDQMNLATWTYTKNMSGQYTFICESVGYPMPFATQSTNPQHYTFVSTPSPAGNLSGGGGTTYTDSNGNYINGEFAMMPQAEPNGLFIPSDAHGTWNLCRDPHTGKPDVSFQEEELSVFTYRLPDGMVTGFHPQPLDPLSKEDMEKVLNQVETKKK